jgi:glyoxylase-like metal-dependent hydrolase (beta-lactamase superfamily II)
MLRNVLIGFGVLVVAALGAFWWLFLSGAKAPATADGLMDLAGWRALIAADAGQGPERIGWLEIGGESFPSFAVQAGRFGDEVEMSFNSVELAWPGRTIIIDTAVDAETMAKMGQTEAAHFDADAYGIMLAAMSRAEQILLTHEHVDHVIGLARHPDPDRMAERMALTAAQLKGLAPYAPGGVLPVEMQSAEAIDLTQPIRIAPGVVVAAMPGHSPGSQVIFVQRADGAEFLFIGDIAWTMRNIDELTTRPVALNYMIFDPPEVRADVRAQLRALHDLMQSEPGLTVVPAHDRVYLRRLLSEGRLSEGFSPAP